MQKDWSNWIQKGNIVKKLIYTGIGFATYPGLNLFNKLQFSGVEHLKNLPKQNVLFVSNHQTYFADVISFMHIFSARRFKRKKTLGLPVYLAWPYTKVKFVAAKETMKSNLLTRLFALGGAVTVKRTWRAKGQDVQRNLDDKDVTKVENALKKNWVITFPQGTTKSFAPGRKGTAHLIKETQPIVVPVVINGFRRAFNKSGLKFKKKQTQLSVNFKEPLQIDYNASPEVILEQVMQSIEQTPNFMPRAARLALEKSGKPIEPESKEY